MLHLWPPCLNSAQQHLSAGTTSNTQALQTAFNLPMFLGCCFVSIYYKRAFFCSPFFHSPCLPLSCLAPQAVGQRKQRILSSISCVPPVSTASSRRYKGWPKKLHFTTQLGKMPLKPLQSTQETSPLPTVPQELPVGLADHLRMSLYKSDRQAFLCCTHMTASLSLQGCCVFNGQPAAEILMLLLYFRERKKA